LDGGAGNWIDISTVTTSPDVTFADTDGDGAFEMLHWNGTQWDRYHTFDFDADTAGVGSIAGPAAGGDTVLVGHFDADPEAGEGQDIIRLHDVGGGDREWQVSAEFAGAWEPLAPAVGDAGEDASDYDYATD